MVSEHMRKPCGRRVQRPLRVALVMISLETFSLVSPIRSMAVPEVDTKWDRPELQDVSAHLARPSDERYHFGRYRPGHHLFRDVGQGLQDLWVDTVLNRSRGLFAIESGAFDGEFESHTLFLETARQWQCLLIEGNPVLVQELLTKHRKCHVLHGCLSTTGRVETVRYNLRGVWSGIAEHGDVPFSVKGQWRRQVKGNRTHWSLRGFGGTASVRCYPLDMVLQALGRTVVDFWALDTEGSETAILEHTDFSAVEFGVVSVEHNLDPDRRDRIETLLSRHGLERVATDYRDDIFASRRYFQRRGLAFPGPSLRVPSLIPIRSGGKAVQASELVRQIRESYMQGKATS